MYNAKVFKIGSAVVTIDKLYFIPNCKNNKGNLYFIHYTFTNGKNQFTGKILHTTKIPLISNLSIVRGIIIFELKNITNI